MSEMNDELKQIYLDVAEGRVAKSEAMSRIRAVLGQRQPERGSLLLEPVWESSEISAAPGTPAYADQLASAPVLVRQQHIILCELPASTVREVSELVSHSHFLPLQAAVDMSVAERFGEYALACFERLGTILKGKPSGTTLVQIVVTSEHEKSLFAGLSGLLRTAHLENPSLIGQLILVDEGTTAGELAGHLQDNQARPLDTRIRYVRGARQVQRWRAAHSLKEEREIAFKDSGIYLVTGGLGGLGKLFAREILEKTNHAKVVLSGRSRLSDRELADHKGSILEGLSVQAERLEYRQLDLSDLPQVHSVLASIKNAHGQLNGIIHSAGMILDNFILKKSADEFRKVLEPKVTGTVNLDQASRDIDLDFLVLFSSVSGALGNVGQADYASANAFMDRFAVYRNQLAAQGQRKGHALSIDWPLWQEGGMSLDEVSQEALERSMGMHPMKTRTGMQAFYRSLSLRLDQCLVMEGNLQRMRQVLLEEKSELSEAAPLERVSGAEVDPAALLEKSCQYLGKLFAIQLKLPAHEVDFKTPFEKYGVDSISAMSLTNELEKTFGSLPKTLFFEYQTIQELSDYFVSTHSASLISLFALESDTGHQLVPASAQKTPRSGESRSGSNSQKRFMPLRSVPSFDTEKRHKPEPIAIIGLTGRYPGALDVNAYWQNLREGKDCITEVPEQRWNWREFFSKDRSQSGTHYSKWGGFIEGVDEFDPRFFNIAPREAHAIDPQERLFLQHAWMAIEDAGYTRSSLQIPDDRDLPGQVGVYVGVMYGEYNLSGSLASIANRVSYALNLHGPSITLDTMCSSSLTAIHIACQDLKQGRTSLAIAGGVNVSVHPNKYSVLSAGQFISGDGHCQSFGEGGDGYIPAEGVGAVVLKRLSEAQKDGHTVYGVIKGSALNHGGRTNGYSVPNPQAQAAAITRALAESGIPPRHVSYVEAHGTGTKLGDPIEIAALGKAFQRQTQDTAFCLIGSAKSNIGHCESAAGIAGLTKVLLQMKNQQIVPSLYSTRLNPHIDFPSSPFVVNQVLRAWDQPVVDGRRVPRIAGISSFGAGGSNAHLIVEEYRELAESRPPVAAVTEDNKVIVPLSARTSDQLKHKARDLLEFIRASAEQSGAGATPLELVSMAYTLQIGREAMEERVGFLAGSLDQLATRLQAFVDGEQGIDDAFQGQVKSNKATLSLFSVDADLQETVDKWIAHGKLSRLLDFWVKGLDLDWNKLYGEVKPQRISLPTYPFAREKYWIDPASEQKQAPEGSSIHALHPLVQVNTSDLRHQSFASSFTGKETFLSGNSVPGQKVLSPMACLEMARAALELASPSRPESSLVELRELEWGEPLVVAEARQVNIVLLAADSENVDYEIYSVDGESEAIHCQGHASFSQHPAPGRLDLEDLRARSGEGQMLAPLRLSAAESGEGFVLDPRLMDRLAQTASTLIGADPMAVVALDSVRIIGAGKQDMQAWIRYASARDRSAGLDVDLCDTDGNICVQIRGLRFGQATPALPALDSAPALATPVATPVRSAPRPLPLPPLPVGGVLQTADQAADYARPRISKPAGITLASPDALSLPAPSARSATVSLAATLTSAAVPQSESDHTVSLFDHDNGVFWIHLQASVLTRDLCVRLQQALDTVQKTDRVKVVLISGTDQAFLTGGTAELNEAIEQKLYQAIAAFPYPVVGVMKGDALGAGFLLGMVCDFMICSQERHYGLTDPQSGLHANASIDRLFRERFGPARTDDLLYLIAGGTGQQLLDKGWSCPVLPASQVDGWAEDFATTLAQKSRDALSLLKQHLARHLIERVNGLQPVDQTLTTSERAGQAPEPIHSDSDGLLLAHPDPGALVVRLTDSNVESDALLHELGRVFAQAGQTGHKTIVLVSDCADFLPASLQAAGEQAVLGLQRLVLESAIPVIAVIDSDTHGAGWFVSQFCDACIYRSDGQYAIDQCWPSPTLAQQAAMIFAYRLGDAFGREVMLSAHTGADLQHQAKTPVVADQGQTLAAALQIAARWIDWPRATLTEWKHRTAVRLRDQLDQLSTCTDEPEDAAAVSTPTPIVLESTVISATAHPTGIVEVTMEDREARNMFSAAFMQGMNEVFAHIDQTPGYKVVVLKGYDSYFASGGTKESLLAIQEGTAKFTDDKVYQLALKCRLPVIAAMQGHGIGAGWALGMFADFILFSEESRYVSPYMNYGFTPGAGSTLIFPERIGYDLARETLLTAREMDGSELKERGLPFRVLPRKQLHSASMALAQQLTNLPRTRLLALKQQWTAHIHQPLDQTCQLELAMHEKTFVGQTETLAKINSNFHQDDRPKLESVDLEDPIAIAPNEGSESANESFGEGALLAITAILKQLLADELHLQVEEIDEDAQFVDLGLDSITGVTWIRKINERYKLSIEATKVYSYPTLEQLSRYVRDQAVEQGPLIEQSTKVSAATIEPETLAPRSSQIYPPTVSASRRLATRRGRQAGVVSARSSFDVTQPIVVVGMAGQFPQARNLDEFWHNIANGKDCVSEVPSDRWDTDAYYQEGEASYGKTYSKWMGSLEEYDLFDPLFFTISPTEAESMDPQQRVFLQACWHSIEHAGYNAQALSGSKCGVFVGCASGDYNLLTRDQQLSAQGFTGGATSILAARVSYVLNLTGPCLSIDTACSSSLVAIASACDSLMTGSSDIALAGGVYIMAGPEMLVKTSQAGMLSPDGKCFTFDQRANGFVPGEGVGVVMLKRLADAQADDDIIYGTIEGWGVNQDGRTNGITAPNAESQTRLLQDTYDRFKVDPGGIQLIEAHGTGTKLGDPIEISGLKSSFSKYTEKQSYCALGSVKSNIGHCLTAAGIAGVLKVILAIKHRQLPPTINFERLNEHVVLDKSPFYVNDRLQEWTVQDSEPRRAAINSFGFSGTNAHVIIAEYLPEPGARAPVVPVTENSKVMIPLSARNFVQLEQKARDLLTYLEQPEDADPSDIQTTPPERQDLLRLAYTLQVGREAMEERVGFLVDSVDQLQIRVRAFLNGDDDANDIFRGQVKKNREGLRIVSQDADMKEVIVDRWISERKLTKLLDLWVKGLEFDWNKLYGQVKPQRLALPGYPFAKERYWVEAANSEPIQASSGSEQQPVVHPLLHSKTSDLLDRGYRLGKGSMIFEDAAGANVLSRPRRISVPTYPFARERCWIEAPVQERLVDKVPDSSKDMDTIEDIINRIADDSMETSQAVSLLKTLA